MLCFGGRVVIFQMSEQMLHFLKRDLCQDMNPGTHACTHTRTHARTHAYTRGGLRIIMYSFQQSTTSMRSKDRRQTETNKLYWRADLRKSVQMKVKERCLWIQLFINLCLPRHTTLSTFKDGLCLCLTQEVGRCTSFVSTSSLSLARPLASGS